MNDAGVDVQQRLLQALAAFVESYQARPELVTEQRGWSPVIALEASDVAARVVVSLDDASQLAPLWGRLGPPRCRRRWRSPAGSTPSATS